MEDDYCVTYEYNYMDQIIRTSYYDLSDNEFSKAMADEDHKIGYIEYQYDSDGTLENGVFWGKERHDLYKQDTGSIKGRETEYRPVYSFSYNADGQLKSQEQIINNEPYPYRSFTYDEEGNLTREELYDCYFEGPALGLVETFENGRLVTMDRYYRDDIGDEEPSLINTTICSYDEENRLISIEDTSSDGEYEFEYDRKGRLKKYVQLAEDETYEFNYKYELLGKLKRCNGPMDDGTIQYNYTQEDNTTAVNYEEHYAKHRVEKGTSGQITFGRNGELVRWIVEDEWNQELEYDHQGHQVKQFCTTSKGDVYSVGDTINDYNGNLICVMKSNLQETTFMDGYLGICALYGVGTLLWYKELLAFNAQWAPFVDETFFAR